jgi:nucleotide-binding universal stress UspA family protein
MKQWFNANCDRYGHLITGVGASQLDRLFDLPKAEQIALIPKVVQPAAKNLESPNLDQPPLRNTNAYSSIRKILIPVDAEHARAADLKPILKLARRFDAEVMLLHCYATPSSFDYALGPTALMEVSLHRNVTRAQLLLLCSEVQRFVPKCKCEFTFGSLPIEILQASERFQADLIAVPLSLDFVSHCWTTTDLLDELVRRANCPVLGIPGAAQITR